jgi:hypothetical protein
MFPSAVRKRSTTRLKSEEEEVADRVVSCQR